jgi:hypothetical protein
MRLRIEALLGLEAILCALLPAAALAQAPSFQAEHVYYVDHPVPLAPGLIFSIFGNDLGPGTGCVSDHDEKGIYPKALCQTQVLVGGVAAELLWVQAGQINFRVPQQTPVQGTADMVVVYQSRSSKPVAMPLGIESPTLSLEGPARIGMPIWLKLNMPYYRESGIRYPFMILPASFGCYEVEVRREGVLQPRFADFGKQAVGGIAISGPPCGSIGFSSVPHFKGRLPLHLQYRFDRPGTYEVRLLRRPQFGPEPVSEVVSWTQVEILPADAPARKQWLADKAAHAPTDAADLLTDFLPSILGNPDDETLGILRPYLYHRDRTVREYAMYGLTYWPDSEVGPKLWEWMRAQGPSEATVRYFLRLQDLAAAHTPELAELSISYLQSNSPVLVYGALYALSSTVLPPDSTVNPNLRTSAGDAMVRAADHIIPIDPENTNQFVSDLGQLQDERSHQLLWDIVNRHGPGFEQALIALTWRKAAPDLPKLAQLALQPANGHERDHEFGSLPYALHHSFGDAAIPYLTAMLARTEYPRVRIEAARELVLAGRPEGFAFFASSIANSTVNRQNFEQFLRDQFPELRNADNASILKFAQAHAAAH